MGILTKVLNSKIVERTRRKAALTSGIYLKFKKLSASASEDLRTVKILKNFKFDKVIDIGANTGQFAESLIDFGFKGNIISFEPVESAYTKLQKRASKYKSWAIAEKCALGNIDGDIEINVSKNNLFSSINTISSDYVSYNQDSRSISKEKVPIFKLDSLENKYFSKDENVFLKIDTQGYEKEVIDGASDVLNFIKGIKIEIPLVPIYDEVKWEMYEMLRYFEKQNFICVSINEVAVNNDIGIVHEVDAIFIKKSLF